jgi:hypothetical protein
MYLREALQHCHDLEEEVGHIYDELAALHHDDSRLARLWCELARDERLHARVLGCLVAAQEAEEDDGPFLVEEPVRIDAMRRLIDKAYREVRSGIDARGAVQLAESLEASELNELFDRLVELARPALYRLLGIIEKGLDDGDLHLARLRRARRLTKRDIVAVSAPAGEAVRKHGS